MRLFRFLTPLAIAATAAVSALPLTAQDPPPPRETPPPAERPAAAPASPAADAAAGKPAEPAAEEELDQTASWVGNRFLQTASPLVNDLGIFETNFNHRFYDSVTNSGASRLYGLDNGAAVYFAVDYVPVENLALQIARATLFADYEFAAKATIVRPTKTMPLGLGLRVGLNWLTANYFERQSSGFAQLLVSGTFGDRVTIGAAPSFTQRTPTRKGVINVPVLAAFKVTKSITAMAEFVPQYGPSHLKAQWSFGLYKEVYHHKFALWIGNSGATTIDQMLASDYNGGVRDYRIRLGFNLMRQFDLAGGAP